MIAAKDLIEKFQYALDNQWGYIYGASHEMWSEAKQRAYEKEYSDDPDRKQSCMFGGKWDGHWVTDCSGLFKWSFTMLGMSIAHGSNSIWDKYCSSQGILRAGTRTDGKKLKPGTAVFTSNEDGRHNHIGLYIGDGVVIEAQGAKAGVVVSLVTNKKWTHWGELKGVSYSDREDEKTMGKATVVLPSGATGNTVNMREKESRDSGIICRIPVGTSVEVVADEGAWCCIEYKGQRGWMMSNYLEYDGQGGESSSITPEQAEQIDKALKSIDDAVEVIGSIIGRG